jgi:hypothetical protein
MRSDHASANGAAAISTRARPKRIAFLVDADSVTNWEVDGIIEFSSRRWGGRFDAIIPTNGETIAHDWWQCLLAVDPDIVFSQVALSDQLVERINRAAPPMEIIESPREERTHFGRDIAIGSELAALSVRDIPQHYWRRRRGITDIEMLYIKDTQGDATIRQFVLRNFGLLPGDLFTASMYRGIEHRALDLEHIALETIFQPGFIRRPYSPVFPIDLASQYATKAYTLDRASNTEAMAFQLTVGSSPWDVMYHWNLSLQDRGSGGRDSLWLPEQALDNPKLVQWIGEWTKQFYWGDSQHRRGQIVSYSLPMERLNALVKQLEPHAGMPFKTRALNPASHPFPNSFAKFDRHVRASAFDQADERRADQVPLSRNSALVPYPAPPFFEHRENRAGWMVDVEMEYHDDDVNYIGDQPAWRVPRRVSVPHLFVEQGGNRARITSTGIPSFEVSSEGQRFKLRLPSTRDLIWTSCFGDGHYKNTRTPHASRKREFDDIGTSDKGQYLRGVIQLFGGLYAAEHFFDDPFWRHLAYMLSSRDETESFEKRRQALAAEAIDDALKQISEPVSAGSSHIGEVAKHVAERLTFRDNEGRAMTLEQIASEYGSRRGAALRENPQSGYWKAYERFDSSKREDFNGYLAQGVFIQGIQFSCPHCNLPLWRRSDELKPVIECEGCLDTFAMRAAPDWSFRINNLIGNAIRYHGTLAVLLALSHMRYSFGFGSVMYLPCQDLFVRGENESKDFDRDKPPIVFTDLDLMLVVNGTFIIGEVKSSPSGFRQEEIDKLRVAALDLLPDRVVVAAVGKEWPREVSDRIGKLTAALKAVDIELSLQLLQWER